MLQLFCWQAYIHVGIIISKVLMEIYSMVLHSPGWVFVGQWCITLLFFPLSNLWQGCDLSVVCACVCLWLMHTHARFSSFFVFPSQKSCNSTCWSNASTEMVCDEQSLCMWHILFYCYCVRSCRLCSQVVKMKLSWFIFFYCSNGMS